MQTVHRLLDVISMIQIVIQIPTVMLMKMEMVMADDDDEEV